MARAFCSAILVCFFSLASSSVEVTLDENIILGPFTTTRYSNLIGDFDGDCFIEATATFIAPDENPCDLDTIQRDISGQVIILSFLLNNFGCFEETIYGNLEALGVLAVLNTDPQPPGATLNRLNWGKEQNEGEVPLLDTGLEFFGEVFIRVAESGEAVTVSIDGCDDENQFRVCINIIQTILAVLMSFIYLYAGFLAIRALKDIKYSRGTAPRIFILRFALVYSIFTAAASASNLASLDGFFYPSGGLLTMGVRGIVLGIISGATFFLTLVAAYYWSYLESKCFRDREAFTDNDVLNYFILNRKKEFFSRMEFKLITVTGLVSTVIFINTLVRPNPDLLELLQLFNFLDIALMGLLLFANYTFISKATKVIKQDNSTGQGVVEQSNICQKFMDVVDGFTGRGLQKHLKKSSNLQTDSASLTTMRLTLHLGYWLQIYALLVIILTFLAQFFLVEVTSFFKLETDRIMDTCFFVVPPISLFTVRGLMIIPVIQGIKGPERLKPTADRSRARSDLISESPLSKQLESKQSLVSTFHKESISTMQLRFPSTKARNKSLSKI